ncbi:MAG: CAP domain-containing protein [Myxococcota bacterium]
MYNNVYVHDWNLALTGLPGCYEGYEEGEPWMPGGDEAADEGDDGDDGDDGNADGGNGDDGNADGGNGDDGNADDGNGDDGNADDGNGDDGSADDGNADDGSADDGMDDDGMDDGEPPPADPDVPQNVAYCNDVAGWDAGWSQLEVDVLELVNMYRASGYNCGSAGNFGPAAPLTMQPNLRCSSRVHSKDMDTRNFFAHDNPSGESPFDRMGMAGYNFSTAGENIAAGSSDAAGTMNQWMNSDGHCGNIMNPNFTEIGVGYHPGGQYGTLWTQNFGA